MTSAKRGSDFRDCISGDNIARPHNLGVFIFCLSSTALVFRCAKCGRPTHTRWFTIVHPTPHAIGVKTPRVWRTSPLYRKTRRRRKCSWNASLRKKIPRSTTERNKYEKQNEMDRWTDHGPVGGRSVGGPAGRVTGPNLRRLRWGWRGHRGRNQPRWRHVAGGCDAMRGKHKRGGSDRAG